MLREEFQVLKQLRVEVNQLLEQARAAKVIGPSLEATVEIQIPVATVGGSSESLEDEDNMSQLVSSYASELGKLFITSEVVVTTGIASSGSGEEEEEKKVFVREVSVPKAGRCRLLIRRARQHKCPRCWTFTSKEKDALCVRCAAVLGSLADQ